jgi:hypothetical protein
VSLVAVWRNEEAELPWRNEEAELPSIWVATDSRISGHAGVLLDEGGKLFSLPVVCRRPDDRGWFDIPYFAQEIGLACVGGSLIYQQVYACLIPVLSNLISMNAMIPSQEDIAGAVARVTTRYVASLGQRDPSAHRVRLVLVGHCALHERQEACELTPMFESGLFRQFDVQALGLEEGATRFFGDHVDDAQKALTDERERADADHSILWHRAPIDVLKKFIADPERNTIGGDVQLGYVRGMSFTRVTTVAPRFAGQSEACMRLNNIDLDEIGSVGPCQIGLAGMIGLV